MAVAAAVALSGLIALPVIARTSSSGPGRQRSAVVFTGPATTGPPVPAPTTTEAPATTVPPPESTTTTTAPVRQAAPVTTTTLVCRNSYEPACGPFRWDPSPAPAGTPTVSIKYSPSNPLVGQQVTFTVTISDPNTAVYTCGQIDFGPGGQACTASTASPNCQVRYGPWTPPARYADTVSTTYPPYTYQQAGTYTVVAKYPVGTSCYDPYQGQVSGQVTVTVSATPSTATPDTTRP